MSVTGMVLALGTLGAAPSPSDGEEFTPATVSPGLPGFIAMCSLAVVVAQLAIDMTRRTRRVQARARVEERMDAERTEREARAAAQSADDGEHGLDEPGPDAASTAGGASDPEARPGTADDSETSALEQPPLDESSSPDDDHR